MTTATSADTALRLLLHSRDADSDATIWHDDGRTLQRLATTAGVRVGYVHAELGHACTVEYRTVQP
jgi:hypothetical protein